MNDTKTTDLPNRIRDAAIQLNDLLAKAFHDGLRTEIEVHDEQWIHANSFPLKSIDVKIFREA